MKYSPRVCSIAMECMQNNTLFALVILFGRLYLCRSTIPPPTIRVSFYFIFSLRFPFLSLFSPSPSSPFSPSPCPEIAEKRIRWANRRKKGRNRSQKFYPHVRLSNEERQIFIPLGSGLFGKLFRALVYFDIVARLAY